MPVKVKLKYLRIAPRKVRLVADSIRGKGVEEAESLLEFIRKKAAKPLKKLLKSAVATAENDFKLVKSNLYITEIRVDEGPTLKRWRAQARGRIAQILKRTSHVTLVLDEIKPGEKLKKLKKPKKVKEKPKRPEIKRPRPKIAIPRPKFERAVKRIFRRKAF